MLAGCFVFLFLYIFGVSDHFGSVLAEAEAEAEAVNEWDM
jgi:hypothetical protein